MNKLAKILKDPRFIAATVVTVVSIGVMVMQKKSQPALDVTVDV